MGVRGDSRRDCVKPLITLIPFHIKFVEKKEKKIKPIPKCIMKEAIGSEHRKAAHRALGEWMQETGLAWCSTNYVVGWP